MSLEHWYITGLFCYVGSQLNFNPNQAVGGHIIPIRFTLATASNVSDTNASS
jgi:hypothetical protein